MIELMLEFGSVIASIREAGDFSKAPIGKQSKKFCER
jgi:hypothetical protein